MHWLFQKKFIKEKKYQEILRHLERLDLSYTFCDVIPFTDDGIYFEDEEYDDDNWKESPTFQSLLDKPIFAFGSYTLAKIAKKHFKPASFISPNISIDKLFEHYGDEMFNSDMIIASVKDIDTDMAEFFIRPVEDTKSFCGEVMTQEKFRIWKQRILDMSEGNGYTTITPDTMVTIAGKKQIEREYRFFIVNRQIATCSQYRWAGQSMFITDAEPYVKDYVDKIINHWSPDHAFCLDIATVDGVPKVLEVNCINASGMYEIDTQKLVMAVESLNDCTEDYVHNINLTALPSIK